MEFVFTMEIFELRLVFDIGLIYNTYEFNFDSSFHDFHEMIKCLHEFSRCDGFLVKHVLRVLTYLSVCLLSWCMVVSARNFYMKYTVDSVKAMTFKLI